MELEMTAMLDSLSAGLERLSVAAKALEHSAARLEEREVAISGDVQKITAAVETSVEVSRRELELERKLMVAEQKISDLMAAQEVSGSALRAASARKTLPAATVQLLAKQGVESLDTIEAGTIDAALCGLSIEQRIAVKSQLLRAGALLPQGS